MLLKRFLCVISLLCLCIGCVGALDAADLGSDYAVLMCADTGEVLFEKNARKSARPASITKVLTALVALEQTDDFSQTTTVTETALDVEYDSTRIGLLEGEEVSLQDMLYAMLISSANDASNVLAEGIAGSLDEFVALMNQRIEELGCTDSHFENPHGLDGDKHYTSAYDMALITRELLKHPEFEEISSIPMYVMEENEISGEKRYFNRRQTMLMQTSKDYYEGAFAAKNGYTSKARQTQVVCAERDGMTLIAVILHCPSKGDKISDITALLDYGFDNYDLTKVDVPILQTLVEQAGIDAAQVALSPLTLALPKSVSPAELEISKGTREYLKLSLPDSTRTLAALPYVHPDKPADSAETLPVIAPAPEEEPFNWKKHTKTIVLASLGAVTLLGAVGVLLHMRQARVERNREELLEMLRAAAKRRDAEYEKLMERRDVLGKDTDSDGSNPSTK